MHVLVRVFLPAKNDVDKMIRCCIYNYSKLADFVFHIWTEVRVDLDMDIIELNGFGLVRLDSGRWIWTSMLTSVVAIA